ncbi:hypothetical protein [Bosea sp. ANAM02]|uniref:hypothetical protein n=1 Tax=Bosea sp. ANAM02 TaxID=2020412 RepID=UPI0015665EBA|nr:hypothetical protein [Bosea sp. ANAM02]
MAIPDMAEADDLVIANVRIGVVPAARALGFLEATRFLLADAKDKRRALVDLEAFRLLLGLLDRGRNAGPPRDVAEKTLTSQAVISAWTSSMIWIVRRRVSTTSSTYSWTTFSRMRRLSEKLGEAVVELSPEGAHPADRGYPPGKVVKDHVLMLFIAGRSDAVEKIRKDLGFHGQRAPAKALFDLGLVHAIELFEIDVLDVRHFAVLGHISPPRGQIQAA